MKTYFKVLSATAAMMMLSVSGARAQWLNFSANYPSIWSTANWAGGDINGVFANGTLGSTSVLVNSATYAAGSNVIYTGTYNARQLSIGSLITGAGIPDGAYVTGIDNAGRVTISAATTGTSSGPLTVINVGKADSYGTVRYASVMSTYISGATTSTYTHSDGTEYALTGTTGILTISGTTLEGMGARITQNLRQNTYWQNGVGMNIAQIIDGTTALIIMSNATWKNESYTGQNVEFTSMTWQYNATGSGTITGDFVYRNTDPWLGRLGADVAGSNITFAPRASGTVRFVMDTNRVTGASGFHWGDSGRAMVTNFSGQDAYFQIGKLSVAEQMDVFHFYNTGTNLTSLTKSGVGVLALDGGASQVLKLSGGSGVVTVSEGVIQLATQGQNLATSRITGVTRYDIGQDGVTGRDGNRKAAALYLDLGSVNASQTQVEMLNPAAQINLYSGVIGIRGNGTSALPAQTFGDVVARGGRVGIGFLTDTANNFTLTLNSLTRENNATVSLLGLATAGVGSIKIASDGEGHYNDANLIASLVGAGDSITSVAILPWVTARTVFGAGDNGINLSNAANHFAATGLVTYTSAGGFRVLDISEYVASVSAAADGDNVRLTASEGLAPVSELTINSLTSSAVVGDMNLALGAGSTLTVTSGVVARFGSNFNISGGTLETDDRPLILYSDGGDFTIGSVIHNNVTGTNASLIAATGVGRTFLDGVNNYTGATIVQSILNLRNEKSIPVASAVRIDSGGVLLIDGGAKNAGAASLSGRGFMPFNSSASRFVLGGSDSDRASELAGYLTVRAGAYIAPGDASGPYQAGELTLGNNILGVRFKADAIFDLDLASDTVSDILNIIDNTYAPVLMLDDGAIVRLNFLNNYTPSADAQWLLTTGFASVSGNLDNILLKDSANQTLSEEWSLLAFNGNLMLNYSAIPEPSVWALLLTGAAALTFTLRRRR